MAENERTGLTILVVEDEPLVRLTISEFLRGADCEVVEAATAAAAIAMLEERDVIDAVLTDIQLGGDLNGWDVAEASRVTHPNVPVIYVSGAAVVAERLVPGSIFLEKPCDPAAVLVACQTLCETS